MPWFLKICMAAAATVTIACLYPCHHHRKKIVADEKTGRSLPRPQWFLGLVQEHGLHHLLTKKLQSVPVRESGHLSERNTCYLVKLVPDVEFKGPLTPFDRECKFLWEYFKYPADAFTLRVAKCFKFNSPVKLGFDRERFAGLVQIATVPMRESELAGCMSSNPELTLQGSELQQALGITPEQWSKFLEQPTCFGVPHVIQELIGRSVWSKLLVLASWSTRKMYAVNVLCEPLQFPSNDWLRQLRLQNKLGTFAPPRALKFGPEHAQKLSLKIRHAAPLLLNVFDGEEAALELFEWEDLVSRLGSFVGATGSGARKVAELPSSAGVLRRGNRYDVASIVGTLASAMQLRDRHDLRRIVQQTTSVIFPECVFDESVWQKIPSGPTLSRAQLLVDAAFCCFMRDRYAQQKFRMYLLADSSPQAGEDYLLSTALMIASHDLERCFVAASYMRSSWMRSLTRTSKKIERSCQTLPCFAMNTGRL